MVLSPHKFYAQMKRFAETMPCEGGSRHFMHDEKKRRLQHRNYRPYFSSTIHYRNRWIAVEILCDPSGDRKGKVFCRVLSTKMASSTNTQHVTLTNQNVTAEGFYFVEPRLDKCGGQLKIKPQKIGPYPYRASKLVRYRKFIVGPLDQKILARVFEVAIAKYDSIQMATRLV